MLKEYIYVVCEDKQGCKHMIPICETKLDVCERIETERELTDIVLEIICSIKLLSKEVREAEKLEAVALVADAGKEISRITSTIRI